MGVQFNDDAPEPISGCNYCNLNCTPPRWCLNSPIVNFLVDINGEESECDGGGSKSVKNPMQLHFFCLGVVGNNELSGENTTMACNTNNTNPTAMHVGCHENRSVPGEAKYTVKAVKASDMMCTTIVWEKRIKFNKTSFKNGKFGNLAIALGNGDMPMGRLDWGPAPCPPMDLG